MLDIQEIKNELIGKKITFKGEDLSITDIDDKLLFVRPYSELYADLNIMCSNGKSLALFMTLQSDKAKVDADTYEYLKTISPEMWTITEQARAEEQLRREEALKKHEEQQQIAKDQKAQKKYEQHIKTAINSYKTLKAHHLSDDTVSWLRDNVKSIKAVVPDFLESYFRADFPDAPYKAIDTKTKRTSGGYLMQWNIAMRIALKKNVEVPDELQDLVKGNTIKNNALARTLVWDYGFNFS